MMKIPLLRLAILSVIFCGIALAKPVLTTGQVTKLGRVILEAKENQEYKKFLWDASPTFNAETKQWSFLNADPFPGGKIYVLELREKDGNYRLGWINHFKKSPNFERFKIQPSIRKKFITMFKDFRNGS